MGLAAEPQVKALHLGIVGEQDVDFARDSGGALRSIGKSRQGEAAKLFCFSPFQNHRSHLSHICQKRADMGHPHAACRQKKRKSTKLSLPL